MVTLSSNPFSIRITPGPQPTANVPAWVPPAGYFADVPMTNFPQDVMPAMYRTYPADTNAMDIPFTTWGGSAILRDYSPLGAQVYHAGGHEATGSYPNLQFSLICDFSSLTWSVANLPAAPNRSDSFVNGYAPDGTPYTPHTYLGLQELPAAWGGGPKGTLATFFFAGSGWDNRINLLDVSQASGGYSQLKTRQDQNVDPTKIGFEKTSAGGSYPITVMDVARQGWWAAQIAYAEYTLFISKTGQITQYPALGGNLSNGALVLCPSLNLLVAVDGGYIDANNYRSMYFRDLTTGAMTKSMTLGDVPSVNDGYDGSIGTYRRPDVMGLQWVEEYGCIIGLDQSTTPPTIVKLKPPANNPATEPWTWSVVTSLQHWPKDAGGQAVLQSAHNNLWSKFRWVPSLKAFVYGTAKDRRPQVIKL